MDDLKGICPNSSRLLLQDITFYFIFQYIHLSYFPPEVVQFQVPTGSGNMIKCRAESPMSRFAER